MPLSDDRMAGHAFMAIAKCGYASPTIPYIRGGSPDMDDAADCMLDLVMGYLDDEDVRPLSRVFPTVPDTFRYEA